tara:strand:- start:163 stop:939 length:777 start_codon:yes stop_codon:yes gene_type:complete
MSKRKDPDWFLKLFFYLLVVTFGLIVFLAASVYSKTTTWDEWLRESIYGDEYLMYDDSVDIQAPYRALDPAGVEISLRDAGVGVPYYTKMTLIIDENPTPCCAEFEFHGIIPHILTNVRVNAYTHLTLVTEDSVGNKRYNKRFIKAAGGCSAPPLLVSDKPFGTIHLLQSNGWTKIKIWHPNYSGMQFDQLTRSEIPAEFIEDVKMWVDGVLVWEYRGSIGIAQDVFFMMPIHTIKRNVYIEARDNLGNMFKYDSYAN